MLDTSAIAAFTGADSELHDVARAMVREPHLRLLTTSAVIGEAFTLLRRRIDYGFAFRVVRDLQASSVVTIHHVDTSLEAETWRIIEEFAGVPLSYVDGTLIALGRRLRISRVFAFDDDFARAGLRLAPG